MPTDPDAGTRRRLAVVLADCRAVPPPGIDPETFARACLADTYEVLAQLVGVESGIAGPEWTGALLWPGGRRIAPDRDLAEVIDACVGVDEVVLVAGDAPDLPGLVVAKMFRALQRADACVAPERAGSGCVGVGVRLPLAGWLSGPASALRGTGLDQDLTALLAGRTPRRSRLAVTPDWHRLRTPDSVHRLDPGLEGWEETRALLSGHRLSG